jgi:hypothetical protein
VARNSKACRRRRSTTTRPTASRRASPPRSHPSAQAEREQPPNRGCFSRWATGDSPGGPPFDEGAGFVGARLLSLGDGSVPRRDQLPVRLSRQRYGLL